MNIINTASRFGVAAAASVVLLTFGMSAPGHAAGGSANNQDCGDYCANPTPSPSGNGVGRNQPAAGTKGNADNKNPYGQAKGGDGNRGYECSINQGIARSNPAHTGCATDGAGSGEGSGDGSGEGSGEGSGDGSGSGSVDGDAAEPGSGYGYECYPNCGD